MRETPFVDAHVHLWELGRLRYPWLTPPFSDAGPNGSVEAIAHDYGLDDYLADAANWNVAGLVHVEAGADPRDALAETEWLEGLAGQRGLPSGLVAFAALDDPRVGELLAAHAAHGRVRAIRHIANWHPDPGRTYTPRDLTTDAAWLSGYAQLARHALSFDLQAYPAQFPALAAVIARHPQTPVAINHMGMPVESDPDGLGDWQRGMAALAALPHVCVKLSGAGFIRRPWSAETVGPYVLRAIDLFGPERCMFASDFPTDALFGGFDATLDAYAEIIAGFSPAERAAMWGRAANRHYRLGLDLGAAA
ncbi:MAG: amidohydrolase family protein [Caulobacterales bacterium]|nr:amidohydrolase family protein [Caulobacterales bacterium]